MNTHWLTIRQLDRQLSDWRAISHQYRRPRAGWIKTLREAFCMTAEQLAERLGLSRMRIIQLEHAEVDDAVTLRSLKAAANALECEVIYAIVPKGNLTFEAIIKKQAEKVATEMLGSVAHTMALEEQALDGNSLQYQKRVFYEKLIEHLNKKIWAMPGGKAENQEQGKKKRKNTLNKLINTLRKK